jgi:AcrR family transcriptional regulator
MPVPKHLQPRKEPQQARSRALVDDVLEATARVLVARGYDALQLREVAEVAGVSPGSLYQYFPHREALVTALLERQSEREVAFLEERLAALAPTSIADVLEQSIASVLAFRATNAPLQDALLAAIPHVGRYYDLRARGGRVAERLRALLGMLYEERAGRPTLDEVTYVVANAVHSLTHEGLLRRPVTMTDERLGHEAARLALAYLRAIEGA